MVNVLNSTPYGDRVESSVGKLGIIGSMGMMGKEFKEIL